MKSQDTFIVSLLEKVFRDASHHVSVKSLARDLDTVRSRTSKEGLSFLTKTLPRFMRWVLEGVERGWIAPLEGFKTNKGGLLPRFLQGWTSRIFFDCDGLLRPDMDCDSFSELYQICSLVYKLELPHSKECEARVVSQFIKNEDEIKAFVLPDDSLNTSVRDLARGLLVDLFRGEDWSSIVPSHGPGAVATGETENGKYDWKRKYQRLHQEYPYYRYFSPSLSMRSFESGWYRTLVPELNSVAEVVMVPKDSRGPRLISMEPLEIMWIQQGIMRKIVKRVRRSRAGKHVWFRDQSKNREAALKGSADGSIATIDLKDASDRVALSLVRDLFPKELVTKVEACRSVATTLPNGDMLPLSKFAPMGSALCFPMMSLMLWALSEATLRLTGVSHDRLLVFGDDIVVPAASCKDVSSVLEAHGLRINTLKSYSQGPFRESCGMDAIKGVEVTPLRLKKLVGTHPGASTYPHLLRLSEAFFDRGYWATCSFLRKTLKKHYGKVPWVHSRGQLGYYCPDVRSCGIRNGSLKKRYNQPLQRYEQLVWTVVPVRKANLVRTRTRWLKGLLGLYSYADEPCRVALRGKCNLHQRWSPV